MFQYMFLLYHLAHVKITSEKECRCTIYPHRHGYNKRLPAALALRIPLLLPINDQIHI